MDELTGKQRRHLRALGNPLKATVFIGRDGVSAAVLHSIEEAYANRELLKLKIERSCPLDRKEAGQQLATATKSHLVQVMGQTVLLYRADPEEPQIALPS
jgi:RNA-binding protein